MDIDALFKQTDTGTMKKLPPRGAKMEFTSLYLKDELAKEDSLRGLLPLCCHVLERGRWSTRRFLLESQTIRIGSRIGRADIVINGPYVEDVHVTLRIFGNRWHIIESGIYNLLSINGIRRRQALLERWSPCFLKIGDTPIVITIPPRGGHTPEPAVGNENVALPGYRISSDPEHGRFFEPKRAALLGAGSSCDVKCESDEFGAIVCPFENGLYLHPLFQQGDFKVDGRPARPLHPLKAGSTIEIGKSKLRVDTESLKGTPSKIPDVLDVDLCLLEILDDGERYELRRLPPVGESFSIGRGHENFLRVDSKNVSRQHAKAKVNNTTLFIEDCYSRNGSYVNDERAQRRTVRPGELLRFADKDFLLSFAPGGAAPEAEAKD